MIIAPHENIKRASDVELRRFVQSALGGDVRRIERALYEYHSSFAIEVIEVEVADGAKRSLIFKDLSPVAMLPEARRVRPRGIYEPQREVIVYREILSKADLGTAFCFGSLVDPIADRFWLLLEKVDGNELYTIGDLSVWCHVARWLAQMHSQFSTRPSKREHDGALLKYDEDFFARCWDRAKLQLKHHAAAGIVDPEIVRFIGAEYRRAAARICELPRTLIHGEFYPSNVLVSGCDRDFRICAIDWETAGIGTGLVDLAALVSGGWTQSEREQLSRAYFDELTGGELTGIHAVGDFETLQRDLLACRLHVAVWWLGWTSDWQPPPEHQQNWLREAIEISQQLRNSKF